MQSVRSTACMVSGDGCASVYMFAFRRSRDIKNNFSGVGPPMPLDTFVMFLHQQVFLSCTLES